MDKPAALAQLQDIHLPTPIGWWPLAPGWWGIMIMVVLLMVWLSRRTWLWWQALKPKRQALKMLNDIEQNAKENASISDACAQVSQLLRRVALTYFPAEAVAGLKGDDWIAFLNNHGKQVDFNAVREHLLVYPYDAQCEAAVSPLIERARAWIKQRRQPWSR